MTRSVLEHHDTLEWSERGSNEGTSQSDDSSDDFDAIYMTDAYYEVYLQPPKENSRLPLSDEDRVMMIVAATPIHELEVREAWWKELLRTVEDDINTLTTQISQPGGETPEIVSALELQKRIRNNLKFAIIQTRLILTEVPPNLTDRKIPKATHARVVSLVQAALGDYLEDMSPEDKVLYIAEIGVRGMLKLGLPREHITLIQQYKPILQRLRADEAWDLEESDRERAIKEGQQILRAQAEQQAQHVQQLLQQQRQAAPPPAATSATSRFSDEFAQAKQIVQSISQGINRARECPSISQEVLYLIAI